MDLWHILILGVARLGLDSDYDRLEHLANYDVLLREILGLPPLKEGGRTFHQKTLSQNVCHVDEELLAKINTIVVRHGRKEFKQKENEKIAAKTDSYVLETNVHFSTDLNLLWDAARKSVDLVARLSESCGLGGWRKAKHWKRKIKGQMRLVGKISQGGGKNKTERVRQAARDYVAQAGELEDKVLESLKALKPRMSDPWQWILFEEVEYFHQMLIKHIDLVQRRLVQGETIGHEEKVFSLFEEHTEWITKGKRRPVVELGHKLLVTTDQYDLVLDYKVMEKSQDAQETLELTRRLFEAYGEEAFGSMSFDKGFSKTTDRQQLEKVVPLVVMPKKGRLSEEDRQRECSRQFVRFKNRHSAIESNINTLEHHGLNRCPDKGLGGYKRYVGFGVLAYNLHRIGAQRLRRQRDQRPGKRPLKRAA